MPGCRGDPGVIDAETETLTGTRRSDSLRGEDLGGDVWTELATGNYDWIARRSGRFVLGPPRLSAVTEHGTPRRSRRGGGARVEIRGPLDARAREAYPTREEARRPTNGSCGRSGHAAAQLGSGRSSSSSTTHPSRSGSSSARCPCDLTVALSGTAVARPCGRSALGRCALLERDPVESVGLAPLEQGLRHLSGAAESRYGPRSRRRDGLPAEFAQRPARRRGRRRRSQTR